MKIVDWRYRRTCMAYFILWMYDCIYKNSNNKSPSNGILIQKQIGILVTLNQNYWPLLFAHRKLKATEHFITRVKSLSSTKDNVSVISKVYSQFINSGLSFHLVYSRSFLVVRLHVTFWHTKNVLLWRRFVILYTTSDLYDVWPRFVFLCNGKLIA